MRYLLLSDIHANGVALEAVMQHAKRQRWDSVIFLGDAVGYYTQPEKVLTILRDLEPKISIIGNHDALLLALKEGHESSLVREDSMVTEVIRQHLKEVSPENLAFIASFKEHVVCQNWEVTHGALRSQWEYMSTLQNAQDNEPFMETDLCFVGHTHVPKVYASVTTPSGPLWRTVSFRNEKAIYRIPPKAKIIFNPGSVGQPRDGIPLASYVIFDEDNRTLELFRVEYDLVTMQRSVRELGYPEALAKRLTVGK